MLPTRKSVPRSSRQMDRTKIVHRRKLQWHDHVSRSSGLAKTILQSTVKGGRRQGGQRKRWDDNIRNGQAWSSASPRGQWRTEENGENWLRNHLWCLNDPRGSGIDDDDGCRVVALPTLRSLGVRVGSFQCRVVALPT